MKYFEALKKYNQGRDSYCSPKKGTPEHAAVVAIQKGGGGGSGSGAKKPSYADVISAPAPKKAPKAAKAKPTYADVISMPKPAKKKPTYADVISQPKPAKKKPTYADVIAQPKTHMTYADVIMMPKPSNSGGGNGNVMDMSRSGAVSEAPMPRPEPVPAVFAIPTNDNDDRGAGGGVVMPPMPSKARIAELKAKGRALIAQRKADAAAPAGVLGKEAGKMINMALKGRIARKKMKEAEKQMLFDILLQDPPYQFKHVPKSDNFF